MIHHSIFLDTMVCSQVKGYSDWLICCALSHTISITLANNKPDSVTLLTYVWSVFNCINRVLSQHNIKSDGLH